MATKLLIVTTTTRNTYLRYVSRVASPMLPHVRTSPVFCRRPGVTLCNSACATVTVCVGPPNATSCRGKRKRPSLLTVKAFRNTIKNRFVCLDSYHARNQRCSQARGGRAPREEKGKQRRTGRVQRPRWIFLIRQRTSHHTDTVSITFRLLNLPSRQVSSKRKEGRRSIVKRF